jgi:hypothetical protein
VEDKHPRGIRLRALRLAGSSGSDRFYGVSFMDINQESWRPLSIIAGPSQTGKTSIIDFVLYCLGDKEHPQHQEILTYVRAALLETELAGQVTTIERSATGSSSKFASLWRSTFGNLKDVAELRLSAEPPSDPAGLSQFILSACDLDNIVLPESPSKTDSDTQMLSVRDLFRVMWLPNERLDSKNLTFEHSNFMVQQKLLQTIDVMFDVHDAAGTDLAARIRQAGEAAREAGRVAAALRTIVEAEYPVGPLALETENEQALRDVASLRAQQARIDNEQVSAENTLTGIRQELEEAQRNARDASLRVRNRQSLMDRLAALRGQYADDRKIVTFLKEAERLFNPLHISRCPACLSELSVAPVIVGGTCSLCGHEIPLRDGSITLGVATEANESDSESDLALSDDSSLPDIIALLNAEQRATTRRLDELTKYWDRLNADLKILMGNKESADRAVEEASNAVNRAAVLPAPYLAARDSINRRLTDALVRLQAAESGQRLWARLRAAQENAERLAGQASQLRAERREAVSRPDRGAVIARLSNRFGEILQDIGYPKLSDPFLDNKLLPHVRGLSYSHASSGGLVLIGLAWYLAIWEISYEQAARAPGLLLIDSPQKNLGHAARPDDPDFADARLVENFYRHVKGWLAGAGMGAQLVVVDNSPPDSVAEDVIVRYTRNREIHPYGLIDNAVD